MRIHTTAYMMIKEKHQEGENQGGVVEETMGMVVVEIQVMVEVVEVTNLEVVAEVEVVVEVEMCLLERAMIDVLVVCSLVCFPQEMHLPSLVLLLRLPICVGVSLVAVYMPV